MTITKEMEDHFYKRTQKHIDSVRKNLDILISKYPDMKDELEQRKMDHDKSKFQEPELTPYIYVTWKYKCKKDGIEFNTPENIEDDMIVATEHHINNSKHHPEYWQNEKGKIDPNDRDAIPTEMIDGTKMDLPSLAEMVADWHAVAQERGNSAKAWGDKNINKRWKFTDEQIKNIYTFVKDLEEKKTFKEFVKN